MLNRGNTKHSCQWLAHFHTQFQTPSALANFSIRIDQIGIEWHFINTKITWPTYHLSQQSQTGQNYQPKFATPGSGLAIFYVFRYKIEEF
jgi:hypothetical protein